MRDFKANIIAIVVVFFALSTVAEAKDNLLSTFAKDAEAEFYTASEYDCVDDFPCFEISLDYPDEIDVSKKLPWEGIDFRNEPEEYMAAVIQYAAEGNIAVDWNLQENQVRKWYHTPWMHTGNRGREPVRGLTTERGSRWHELSAQQVRRTNNWAVGFYNDRGAYTFGQVWRNKLVPDTSAVEFPIGTVSIKLLFTDATDTEAPYLGGPGEGLTWDAQITRNAQPESLRLLQVDMAVRDEHADSMTGWIFGTFMFDGAQASTNYWDNLVPVGLHWGNDPELTRRDYDQGVRPKEGWVNPVVADRFTDHRPPFGDLGYLGRMNGPVDNPLSSCLACHGRAVDTQGRRGPAFTANLKDMCVKRINKEGNTTFEQIANCEVSEEAERRIGVFFRNLKPGEPFLEGMNSLDYSLQMADGVAHWSQWMKAEYPEQYSVAFLPMEPIVLSTSSTPIAGAINPEFTIPTLPLEQAFGRGDEDL